MGNLNELQLISLISPFPLLNMRVFVCLTIVRKGGTICRTLRPSQRDEAPPHEPLYYVRHAIPSTLSPPLHQRPHWHTHYNLWLQRILHSQRGEPIGASEVPEVHQHACLRIHSPCFESTLNIRLAYLWMIWGHTKSLLHCERLVELGTFQENVCPSHEIWGSVRGRNKCAVLNAILPASSFYEWGRFVVKVIEYTRVSDSPKSIKPI